MSVAGYSVTAEHDTDVRLGLNQSNGNAMVGVTGSLLVTGGEASSAVRQGLRVNRAGFDLATGDWGVDGEVALRFLPDIKVRGSGNAVTGEGQGCIAGTSICMPIRTPTTGQQQE